MFEIIIFNGNFLNTFLVKKIFFLSNTRALAIRDQDLEFLLLYKNFKKKTEITNYSALMH